ncbi:energy transducer TonB [Rhodoplanes azumiensis]|uniref:Protein TonB n=1 Tax=Rhodoplanes azumiensis TaxID=1897628 RepID=A0ABW5AF92_9BRAD
MKASRAPIDPRHGLLTVVPGRPSDADGASAAPPVELRRDTDPHGDGACAGEGTTRGTNVVSLAHVRATRDHGPSNHAAPSLPPLATDDRAVVGAKAGSAGRTAVVLLCSVALHGAVLAAFFRDPPPAASIGLEVISVEMVLGADQLAGLAPDPGDSETTSTASTGEPTPQPDEKLPEKVEDPPPPEQAKVEPTPEEPPPVEQQVATAPPPEPEPVKEPPPPEPTPVIAEEAPESVAVVPPEPPKPQPKPETKPEPKPEPTVEAKPKPVAKPKPKPKTDPKPRVTASATASVASSAASGLGRGRSDLDTNYRGIVAAHLARHKQFPSDARAAGHQGTTSVSFSIDGSGRVTSVRLGRSSGIASLDQETTAMVRRASPFPAPPNGQGMSFSVPVSFFLR